MLDGGHVFYHNPDGGLNDIALAERRKARKTGNIVSFLLDGEQRDGGDGETKRPESDLLYGSAVRVLSFVPG